MDPKHFLKWATLFAVLVVGLIYVASALLVSDRISSLFDFSRESGSEIRVEVKTGDEDGKSGKVTIDRPATVRPGRIPAGIVRFAVFLVLLGTPVAFFHVFLLKPLKDIPLVDPEAVKALCEGSGERRKEAAMLVGEAMMVSPHCPEDDWKQLRRSLENNADAIETVQSLISKREIEAKRKAVEIASMAGLTMAVSSSSLGDGFGMFFWKSKLVYETFRIYGFRPDARTTVSIWAHVVFASLLAASVDELCELFDVSELVGGIGTRAIQGTVGAAVVLKGGQLTRAYLTQGISSESRRWALSEFKNSAKDDLSSVASSVGESLTKIGFKAFSS